MSDITLNNLEKISREDLSALLLHPDPSAVAIVDVRDWDRAGGHIKGSVNVPSAQLDYRLAELVHKFKDKDLVVFHCQLSQQRGPSAALGYMREKRRMYGKDEGKQKVAVLQGGFWDW